MSTMFPLPIILLTLYILTTDAAQDRGRFRFDCAGAGEACQNACFYMNCVNPQPNGHTFRDGGNDSGDKVRNINRWQSGAKVSGESAPCRMFPLSQKVYDAYPFWERLNSDDALQTDEFPMAAWMQNNFQANSWPPRNTLRCIPGSHNSNAGTQYRNFRQAEGAWAPDSTDLRAAERLGPNTGRGAKISQGDWFTVAFMNVDDILMPACKANPDCSNTRPARQFHLTEKRNPNNNDALKKAGLLKWPYDPTTQNAYEMTDVAAQATGRRLRTLRMNIRRSSVEDQDDTYQVRIYAYSDATEWQQVSQDNNGGTGPWLEQTDGPFTIPANPNGPNLGLPLDVTIDGSTDPNNACGQLYINYGDPGTDGMYFYTFSSHSTGYSTQIHDRGSLVMIDGEPRQIRVGPYCMGRTPKDSQERPERNVHEWTCYFPVS